MAGTRHSFDGEEMCVQCARLCGALRQRSKAARYCFTRAMHPLMCCSTAARASLSRERAVRMVSMAACNSLNIYPIGPIATLVGGLCWLTVSIMWREAALITTNLVLSTITLVGLVYTYIQ